MRVTAAPDRASPLRRRAVRPADRGNLVGLPCGARFPEGAGDTPDEPRGDRKLSASIRKAASLPRSAVTTPPRDATISRRRRSRRSASIPANGETRKRAPVWSTRTSEATAVEPMTWRHRPSTGTVATQSPAKLTSCAAYTRLKSRFRASRRKYALGPRFSMMTGGRRVRRGGCRTRRKRRGPSLPGEGPAGRVESSVG